MQDWLTRYSTDSPGSQQLRNALAQALDQANVSLSRLAVAVSGGPDSAVLAIELAILARQTDHIGLHTGPHIFHVHHGLQATADHWCQHVHDLAGRLQLACHSMHVQVQHTGGTGVEAAARQARYQAYQQLASQCGVSHIMLGHHQDDQAETVLLRLLRGSGPTGLAAMSSASERDGLCYVRPWLHIARETIWTQAQNFLMASGWDTVYDPTNHDDSYTRSALRERLTPGLNARWPGWQRQLARHAQLASQTAQILDEVAQTDLAALDPSGDEASIGLKLWRTLSPARQAHVLRYWLARNGLRAPTQAKLDDIMRQLRTLHALGHDRHMRVRHDGAWVCCHRGRVWVERPDQPAQTR